MTLRRILREAYRGYVKHRIGDLAAMLTYYTIFSLFPAALFLVTVTLLVLPSDVLDQAFKMVAVALPEQVSSLALQQLQRLEATAGGGFAIIGIVLAVWGASRGAVALQTALNEIHEVKETRPWWKVQLIAIGTTILVSFLVVIALALLFVGPTVGDFLAKHFDLGTAFDVAYGIGRWLGAAFLVMLVWACLYYFLPNVKRRFRWVTPGAVTGVVLWLLASRGFILYLDHFNSYDKTYGALGGVIIFLTWLWISCTALLVGGEVDDAIDEVRKERGEPGGQVPVKQGEGQTAFPSTPDVALANKERTVERGTNQLALTDLAKRIGDNVSTLAKDHFELAKSELSTGARSALGDGAAVILGGVVALIGLAMLCVTLIVAVEPILPPLWLRLLLGSILYLAVGGGIAYGFIRRFRGEPLTLKATRREATRTVQALREQVQNG